MTLIKSGNPLDIGWREVHTGNMTLINHLNAIKQLQARKDDATVRWQEVIADRELQLALARVAYHEEIAGINELIAAHEQSVHEQDFR